MVIRLAIYRVTRSVTCRVIYAAHAAALPPAIREVAPCRDVSGHDGRTGKASRDEHEDRALSVSDPEEGAGRLGKQARRGVQQRLRRRLGSVRGTLQYLQRADAVRYQGGGEAERDP